MNIADRKPRVFFVGVLVIQIAINFAVGFGTYSDVLSNLPS
jgi:hypothetical protein